MKKIIKYFLFGISYLVVIFFLAIMFIVTAKADLIKPKTEIKPQQVVEIQLTSLMNNDIPNLDNGIKQTWEFDNQILFMRNEIILGSANFNQIYGIKKNFIGKSKIKKLFSFALENKIRKIDTAASYNLSEKIIGSFNNNKFKIISKIPKKPKNITRRNLNKWIKKNVMNSLNNLKVKKLECLLLHDTQSLLSKDGEKIYKDLTKK